MADFKIVANSETIQVDDLKIAPAEADHLKQAISFAGGMRDFPKLPSAINFEQFVVRFFEDGALIVSRATGQGEINFSFDTVDTLIMAITQALEISLDRKKLSPSPRCVGDPGFNAEGDVIESGF